MAIEKEKLIEMYRTMVRIRRFEERVAREFADGNIPGSVHSYIGEEAVAAGAIAHLRTDDYILSTHRGHGHLIAKGGKTDHIGILGAMGIVGSGIPIATGAGLSAKMRGTDQATICFFGDGASNIGRFHEGINLASVWSLPVIFICENNLYAVSVPQSYSMKIRDIADRAVSYGIPGVAVDGMNVIAVYETVGEAVARARRGEGPTLVECKTYRYRGHAEGLPSPYRTKEEVEEWMKKDPIKTYTEKLIEMKVLTKKRADEIDQEMLDEMDQAVKFAQESPFPEPEETLENVYA
jgi:pyruvate dehydrogenase E1 component alpha subunit